MARKPFSKGRRGGGRSGKGDFKVTFEVRPGPKAIKAAYGTAHKKSRKMWRPALRKVGDMIAVGHQQILNSKGGSVNNPWPSLKTADRKRKAGLSTDGLKVSGALRRDLVKKKPVKFSNTSISMGVKGKDFPGAANLHFKMGYAMVGWSKGMMLRANKILGEAATKLTARLNKALQRGKKENFVAIKVK